MTGALYQEVDPKIPGFYEISIYLIVYGCVSRKISDLRRVYNLYGRAFFLQTQNTDFYSACMADLKIPQVHTGSWGTPDFGITEAIGKYLGVNPNNVVPDNAQRALGAGVSTLGSVTNNPALIAGGAIAGSPAYNNSTPTKPTNNGNTQGANTTTTTTTKVPPPAGTDVNSQVYKDYYGTPQNDYEAQIAALLNDEYNTQNSYLNDVEGRLRSDYASILPQIETQARTEADQAGRSKDSSLTELQNQATNAQTRKANQDAEINRTYQELQQGAQQRFGGASSAGQAAYELLSRQQMMDRNKASQTLNEYMQEIEGRRSNVNDEYTKAVENINLRKNNALNSARSDFQNKLLDIEKARAETASQKNARKLEALQAYRNQVFSIQQQNQQFTDQLNYQKQLADLDLQKYAQQVMLQQQLAQQGYGALDSSFSNMNPGQQYKVGGQQFTAQSPTYIGSIGKYKVGTDELGRTIYSDGTAGYTKYDDFGNPIQ